ncbi:MAG: type I DNA topoisomerase [Candidatus Omnitrophota bacterium]|jgi:DNA topoisomerase-1|nr:MAG: type I DNA topoisomerase [Candidatus Omnitrophota bacterium]
MKDKNLVIVESPTKAKTLAKILGENFTVIPSMGHLIDLPAKELGVDIEKNFEPHYVIMPQRKRILASLKKESKEKDVIYVATDPDREGEAIGWHIKNRVFKEKKVLRVIFHEITPQAVKDAFRHPRDFDLNMIEAQAGRRILDRIVGYFLSPLLWKKIVRGLSAGRVQSVALRLIIEREKQINDFIPQEYWEIEAELGKSDAAKGAATFTAKLERAGEKKVEIKNKEEAETLAGDIKGKEFIVSQVRQTQKKRYAAAPFITSTLQQESFNKLHFNATKTMIIAQQLYEGIDIGEESPVGLITYMRTDSTHVAPEALDEVRKAIVHSFGTQYLPDTPNTFKAKKHAQEAHEAIRPTLISRPPESLKTFLSHEQYRLYELIYHRFLASQMTPAVFSITSVTIEAGQYTFVASGSVVFFDGFLVMYNNNDDDKEKNVIPALQEKESLDLQELKPSQHFTKSPPRFSDSSLVKILEEEGIGRPSTYAPIISTLLLRNYVRREKGYFYPTELGGKVCELLVAHFPGVMDVKFTAAMEEELDEVEEGKIDKSKVLHDFYHPFKANLDFASTHIKKEVVKTEEVCQLCGRPMVIKWGRKGKFLSCSGYPECKYSKSITSGVKCPEPDCGGELIQRRSKRGFFYGCSNFPKCKFTSKTLPESKS